MKFSPAILIFLITTPVFVYFNCQSSSQKKSDTSSEEGEGVTVTAEVDEEDSVEFVQAGESVQIGGTNLTQTSRTVTVKEIDILPTGPEEKIIWEEEFEGSTFEIKKLPLKKFLRVDVGGQKGAILQPAMSEFGAKSLTLKLYVDSDMTIAAKIFDLIVRNAAGGNAAAKQIVEEQTLSVLDLVSVAGALRQAKKTRDPSSTSAEVGLEVVASELIDSTQALMETLSEISKEEIAQLISTTSQQTTFSTATTGKSNTALISQIGVLILDKKLQEKTNLKYESSQNPGFKSVKKISANSIEVLAAYIAAQETAAAEIAGYTNSGQISETAATTVTTKTIENTQKYTSDPTLVDTLQPVTISNEEYENFNTVAIATASPTPTPTSDPTPTTTTIPTSDPTPTTTTTPTTNPTPTPTDFFTPSGEASSTPTPTPTP